MTQRPIVCVAVIPPFALDALLAQYGLGVRRVAPGAPIPGSHWMPPEAGLIADTLFLRDDTPVHSVLHESCHYICMDRARRRRLHTNAGGDAAEESAVCYLSVVLADYLANYGREHIYRDMDTWGYSFRLGSTRRWFVADAGEARQWLIEKGLLTKDDEPTWSKRIE